MLYIYKKGSAFFLSHIVCGAHCKVQTEHALWATKTVQTFLLATSTRLSKSMTFEFQSSDVSRALALHFGLIKVAMVADGMRWICHFMFKRKPAN